MSLRPGRFFVAPHDTTVPFKATCSFLRELCDFPGGDDDDDDDDDFDGRRTCTAPAGEGIRGKDSSSSSSSSGSLPAWIMAGRFIHATIFFTRL